MHKAFYAAAILILLTALVAGGARPQAAKKSQHYISLDGRFNVSIIPVGKSGRERSESLIEFRGPGSKLLCGINYSSSDGDHGFGVVKAAWTPDSQYFVFSLTSSGGHQSWHAPTQFYSRETRTIRTLDDYLDGSGITKSDFTLRSPNIVDTLIWEGKSVPVSVGLDSLGKRSVRRAKPFYVECSGGRIQHIDEP